MPLIVATETKDFKSLGRRIDYPWESLRDRLVREFGPSFSILLAEPIGNPGLGRVDWYVDSSAIPVSAGDLDDASRAALFFRLQSMRQQISDLVERIERPNRDADRRFADALRRVAVVPDDLHFVWSVEGSPTLVAWGMVYIDDTRSQAEVLGEGTLRKRSQPAPQSVFVAELEVSQPRKRPIPWSPLLWLIFAGLMAVIYYLLLESCGIAIAPEHSWLARIFPRSCSAVAGPSPEQLRRQDLEVRTRNAELDLARLQGDCAAPQKRATQLEPSPNQEIERRLDREKAQTGQLQISLAWNGLEDLDLHVKCPGRNELFHGNKTACGGTLDVDMNNAKSSEDAVENAVWTNPPPQGQYEIHVELWSRKSKPRRTIPFTVRFKRGEDVKTFNGSIADEKDDRLVYRFSY